MAHYTPSLTTFRVGLFILYICLHRLQYTIEKIFLFTLCVGENVIWIIQGSHLSSVLFYLRQAFAKLIEMIVECVS